MLPALPDAWEAGEVKGLVARGGFVTDVEWSDNRVQKIDITSNVGGPVVVRYDVQGRGGANVTAAGDYEGFGELDGGRITLETVKGGRYEFDIVWDGQ